MDITSFLIGLQKGKASGGGSGGSSGGGSLPAGVYLERVGWKTPNYYYQTRFEYNGDIYCAGLPYAGSGNTICIWKLVDGAWSQIVTNASGGTTVADPYAGNIIEYNGKIHFLGSEIKLHWTWEGGSTFTALANTPTNVPRGYAFVWNGQLMISTYTAPATIYVWDEASDTWSEEAALSSSSGYYRPIVVNNELWLTQSKTLYKYENGTLVGKSTLSTSLSGYTVIGTSIYYFGTDNPTGLRKYDTASGIESIVGYIPTYTLYNGGKFTEFWKTSDGTLRMICGGSKDGNTYFMDFIVHIIEASE